MKRLNRCRVLVCILMFAPCAVAVAEPDSRSADEAAIRAAVKSWNAAAQAKDAEAFASFYAPDAVLMLEGAPDMRGLEAIRAGIGGMMQDPNFSLGFEATEVVVAGSGDLAYELGSYDLSISGPEGSPMHLSGHYVVVWQKHPEGGWKVVVDAPVSDPPAASSED